MTSQEHEEKRLPPLHAGIAASQCTVETPSTIYLLGPSDANWTDKIARPTGFDAGLVELVLPAAAIAQAAQAYGQADNITVVTIQPATLEKCAIS